MLIVGALEIGNQIHRRVEDTTTPLFARYQTVISSNADTGFARQGGLVRR